MEFMFFSHCPNSFENYLSIALFKCVTMFHNNGFFDKLFNLWELSYYTPAVMHLLQIIAFVCGLLSMNNNKHVKLFITYIAICFLVDLSLWYLRINERFDSSSEQILILILFSIIEMWTFYFFFYQIVDTHFFKKILIFFPITLSVTAGLALIFFWIFNSTSGRFKSEVYATITVVEMLINLVFCLMYYLNLLKRPTVSALHKLPAFWISTSIFFLSVVTIPYLIVEQLNFFSYYLADNLTTILHTNYIILYALLLKSFLCRSKKIA